MGTSKFTRKWQNKFRCTGEFNLHPKLLTFHKMKSNIPVMKNYHTHTHKTNPVRHSSWHTADSQVLVYYQDLDMHIRKSNSKRHLKSEMWKAGILTIF